MKTLITISAFYIASLFPTTAGSVFICVSPSAKKYHFTKTCRGIKKCTHTISEVTKESAIKQGYTICLFED